MSASAAAASGSSRVASHAGSWYADSATELAQEFDKWLAAAGSLAVDAKKTRVRAIISPHAGYSYSGPTAAYGFKHVIPADVRRVFVLGPSHHHYTRICELSAHASYATPITSLTLDRAVTAELAASKCFDQMEEKVDEDEHSIEMQLPFLAHVMRDAPHKWTLVPILVGSLSTKAEAEFGALLAPYFADPQNFFVISSDFCHWGKRFSYQQVDKAGGDIADSIERMDRAGMQLCEQQDANGFAKYLQQTQNTICGRHPIGVLLRMLEALAHTQAPISHTLKFLHYAQSSRVKHASESSVSYATAIITTERK